VRPRAKQFSTTRLAGRKVGEFDILANFGLLFCLKGFLRTQNQAFHDFALTGSLLVSAVMSAAYSIGLGDSVRCSPQGGDVLPRGLPVDAIAEVVATYLSATYGTVIYVSYRNKVFKVPDNCVHPEPTFAIINAT